MIRLASVLVVVSSLVLVLHSTHAFQPALKSPLPVPPFLADTIHQALQKQASKTNLSSNLISQLAVIALKLRLADHSNVSCDVTSRSSDLLMHGRLGRVTVKGKSWQTELGLTCRAIEVMVDSCQVDIGKVVSKQKLRLTRPALGKAMIALDGHDFGNFITHPLMKPPVVPGSESRVSFIKKSAHLDPETGTVTFFASHEGQRWKCLLQRRKSSPSRARVSVIPDDANTMSIENAKVISAEMAQALSAYFSSFVLDLGGTSMSFNDMMVVGGKGPSPSVMFSLNVKVRRLPSRSAAF